MALRAPEDTGLATAGDIAIVQIPHQQRILQRLSTLQRASSHQTRGHTLRNKVGDETKPIGRPALELSAYPCGFASR